MSSFLIGYSPLPRLSVTITSSHDFRDWSPSSNLSYGHKYAFAKLVSATDSDRSITWQCGQAITTNFLYIARADLLISQGITSVVFANSSDNSTYTTIDSFSLGSELLRGPRREDIIRTFSTTSSRVYYRVTFSGSSSATQFSKIVFGESFDPGVQPDLFLFDHMQPLPSEVITESGAGHYAETCLPRKRWRITWEGVSDAKINEFSPLVDARINGYVLYTTAHNQILNDETCIYARLINYSREDREGVGDWNTLSAIFEEMI